VFLIGERVGGVDLTDLLPSSFPAVSEVLLLLSDFRGDCLPAGIRCELETALNESHNETVHCNGLQRVTTERAKGRNIGQGTHDRNKNEQRNAAERGMDTAERVYAQSLGSFAAGGPKPEQFCIHKAGNRPLRWYVEFSARYAKSCHVSASAV